ncbi:MAG: T9SS type A sorting domain-containing protein [Ignavibacteriaceae bacterium]|nr:T9SS type A sorting domain-containing protein [Ignavibacteriaceae bacterium]
MQKLNFLILLLLFFVGNLHSTSYFVDNDGGNDDSSGTSVTTAWKTPIPVNNASFNPDDIISFHCGQRFSGICLIPPSSGIPGHAIVFNSYGNGARPVLDGNSTHECVSIDSRTYLKFSGLKFVNGYQGNSTYPSSNVFLWYCNHITFESCNIDSSVGGNIVKVNLYDGQGNYLIVRNCTLNYGEQNLTDPYQGNLGIYLDGTDNSVMEYDTLIGNFSNIRIAFGTDDLGMANNDTIRYCVLKNGLYDNVDDDGSNNAIFYYNIFESSNTPSYHENLFIFAGSDDVHGGFYTSYTPQSSKYINNTFITHNPNDPYNNGDAHPGNVICVNTHGGQSNYFKFENNIFYYDGDTGPDGPKGYIYFSYINPGMGWLFDNNLYYMVNGAYSHAWEPDTTTGLLPNFASWQSYGSHNYDAKSFCSNPLFNTGIYSLQPNSPAILSGTWLNLPNQDIIGTPIGDPPDIGAYQNSNYISGFLNNTTLSGNVAVTNSVVVPEGNTLTISAGTHIKVKNYSSITVYGTLDCNYNSQQGDITFDLYPNFQSFEGDTSWTMVFYGELSSNSILQHATINHNDWTQCLIGANVTIKNCNFLNPTEGIYFYDSAPSIMNNTINNPSYNGLWGEASGLSPWIQGNTIERTTNLHNYSGIALSNSTVPTIYNNHITGFYWGAYFTGGCVTNSRLSWDLNRNCNNEIVENIVGLQTANWSTTDIGQDDGTGASNSIYDDSLDLSTTDHSNLNAYHDWFGSNYHFYCDTTSYADICIYPDDRDMCSQPPHNYNIKNIILASNKLNKSGTVNIYDGLKLENDGRIDDAISFYKVLINNDDHAVFALTNLAKIRNKYKRPEILNYFESILSSQNKYYGKIKNLIGDIYLQSNSFEDAITAYNDVISHTPNSYDGINARFEKLFGYLHIKNNVNMSKQILADIKSMNLVDQENIARIRMAEELIAGKYNSVYKSALTEKEVMPQSYDLSQNYPNPFNPNTTIRYQIPKQGLVTLKVYDIIGREVTTLVTENKIEGSYDFTFNASRFASGVYIYQIRVNDYVASKKMILVK